MDNKINIAESAPVDKETLTKEIKSISNKNSVALLLLFVVADVLIYVFGMLLKHFGEGLTDEALSIIGKVGTYTIYYLIGMPLTIYVANRKARSAKSFFRKPEKGAGFIAKWCVIAYSVSIAVNAICVFIAFIIQSIVGIEFNTPAMTMESTAVDIIFTAIVMVVFAPLFEEMMFRGAVVQNTKKYGAWMAVIVSAVMFGIFHRNYAQLLYTITAGFFFAFVAVKTKSIIPSMIMHFFVNGLAVVLLLMIQSVDIPGLGTTDFKTISEYVSSVDPVELTKQMMPILLWGMLICGVVLLGLILFIIELAKPAERKDLKLENPCPELTAKEKFSAYITAPVTILGLIASVIYMILKMLGKI